MTKTNKTHIIIQCEALIPNKKRTIDKFIRMFHAMVDEVLTPTKKKHVK